MEKVSEHRPLVSVIVPFYNTSKVYFTECLKSLIGQSYTNCEILIVNDGSNDSSVQMLNGLISGIENIRVFHTENKGASSARNTGLTNAVGEYITFVDVDDEIDSHAIEEAVSIAEKNGLDIVYGARAKKYVDCTVPFNFNFTDSTDDSVRIYADSELRPIQESFLAYATSKKCAELNSGIALGPYARLFRKDVLSNVEFVETLTYGEDAFFNFEAIAQAKKVGFVDRIWYYYRQSESSLSRNYWESFLEQERVRAQTVVERLTEYCGFENAYYAQRVHAFFYLARVGAIKCSFLELRSMLSRLFSTLEYREVFSNFDENAFLYGKGKRLLIGLARHRCIALIALMYKVRMRAKKGIYFD